MTTCFPTEYSLVCANAGNPVDLQRIQDETMRIAFEEQRVLISQLTSELRQLRMAFDRRTQVLSPAKGFSNERYQSSKLTGLNCE
jgi:hypothetical protein